MELKGEEAMRVMLDRKDQSALHERAALITEILLEMTERFRQLNGEDYCYACNTAPGEGHEADCPMVRLNEIRVPD